MSAPSAPSAGRPVPPPVPLAALDRSDTDPATVDGGRDHDLGSAPLLLRPSIERLVGIDGRPLLFDVASGHYVAVSETSLRVLDLLADGPGAEEVVARVVRASRGGDTGRIREAVLTFLTELRRAGVLTLDAPPQNRRQRLMGRSLRQRMPRLALTRSVRRWLEPPAVLLRRLPLRLLLGLWAVTTVAALAMAVTAYVRGGHQSFTGQVWIAFVLLVLQICCHEGAHALVCQYLGAPVREAGVTLMLFVFPVAYVDRTDTYRVRGRGARVLVALAGPLSDALWAGATGAVLLAARPGGTVGHVAHMLLFLQGLLMIINLNPLLPSDGYHAIEAATGSINLRGRSFGYLVHLVTRTPLPAAMRGLRPLRRLAYALFGLACLGYGAVLVLSVVGSWWRLVELLGHR